MISLLLFILIGIKLDMLDGWYLGLIVTKAIVDILIFEYECLKKGSEI